MTVEQDNFNNANAALTELKNSLATNRQALKDAEANLKQAKEAAESAKTTSTTKNKELDDARTDKNNLPAEAPEDDKTKANTEVETKKQAADDAKQALEQADAEVVTKQKAVNDATNAVDNTVTKVGAQEEAVASAKTALDAATVSTQPATSVTGQTPSGTSTTAPVVTPPAAVQPAPTSIESDKVTHTRLKTLQDKATETEKAANSKKPVLFGSLAAVTGVTTIGAGAISFVPQAFNFVANLVKNYITPNNLLKIGYGALAGFGLATAALVTGSVVSAKSKKEAAEDYKTHNTVFTNSVDEAQAKGTNVSQYK